MVRALNAMGIVEPDGDRFRVSANLAASFAPGADDLVPFLEHSHDLYERWGESLEPWLRGEPWTTKRRSADGVRRFGAAMQAMAAQIATGVVDVLDLLALLAAWGNTSGPEDINGDGIVDVLDLLELLAAWGPC